MMQWRYFYSVIRSYVASQVAELNGTSQVFCPDKKNVIRSKISRWRSPMMLADDIKGTAGLILAEINDEEYDSSVFTPNSNADYT